VILAFLLLWDPVLTDCHGSAESIPPLYEVWTYRADVTGSYTGPDGSPWPLYSRLQERALVPGTSYPLGEPGIGGVVAWGDPVAVDLSGNRSDGVCP